jgi:hypothetical protein
MPNFVQTPSAAVRATGVVAGWGLLVVLEVSVLHRPSRTAVVVWSVAAGCCPFRSVAGHRLARVRQLVDQLLVRSV